MRNNHQPAIIGDPQGRQKELIQQAMQAMTEKIYVEAAGRIMADPALGTSPAEMQQLAQDCAQAARDFFIGLGVIKDA
jgi:hypothetical protein